MKPLHGGLGVLLSPRSTAAACRGSWASRVRSVGDAPPNMPDLAMPVWGRLDRECFFEAGLTRIMYR